jgi:hypothetical protein
MGTHQEILKEAEEALNLLAGDFFKVTLNKTIQREMVVMILFHIFNDLLLH